jgi:hypothetical protein
MPSRVQVAIAGDQPASHPTTRRAATGPSGGYGRYPARALDPAVKGRFEHGVGHFYSDYTQDGKTVRGRLRWSDITPTSARWEQASSVDGGKTWAPNWIMEFRREAPPARGPAGP